MTLAEEEYRSNFLDMLYYLAVQYKGEVTTLTSFLVAEFVHENEQAAREFSVEKEDPNWEPTFAELVSIIFSVVERELPLARQNLETQTDLECIDKKAETQQITQQDLEDCGKNLAINEVS